jgi:hypothetical protein
MSARRAQTIQIFLPDGDPRGVRIADITSRTVQAVQVPRGVIERAAARPELRQVGVYFLFGDDADGGLPAVYVGEAGDCWQRLLQHHREKDFWTQAVAVTSKTHHFDKAQGVWLEWVCTREAERIGRYRVLNQASARAPHLTEPVRADLADHVETLRALVATLGFPLFEPVVVRYPRPPLAGIVGEPSNDAPGDAPEADDAEVDADAPDDALPDGTVLYRLRSARGADARGQLTADGFAVLAGSVVARSTTPSFDATPLARVRERLADGGVLAWRGGRLWVARDHVFATPSAAASVVLGRTANGWRTWRTAEGFTLDALRKQPPE